MIKVKVYIWAHKKLGIISNTSIINNTKGGKFLGYTFDSIGFPKKLNTGRILYEATINNKKTDTKISGSINGKPQVPKGIVTGDSLRNLDAAKLPQVINRTNRKM